tara:strand:- start:374 stop:661 length:288 start_codon:yes stop_codon:yes gene_type:complete
MTQGRYKAEYYGMQEWSILKDGKEIVPGGLTEGPAKEFVRAVNNHAALVSALRNLAERFTDVLEDVSHAWPVTETLAEDKVCLMQARETLKKATE